jgi:hypothetical protein
MDNQPPNSTRIPQPEDKTRIESLRIAPYPDRYRVLIEIKVTPFQKRPNLLLVARDQENRIVGELDVIATMHAAMEFTLHLCGVQDPAGEYTLTVVLFFENKNPPQDRRVEKFVIPCAGEGAE